MAKHEDRVSGIVIFVLQLSVSFGLQCLDQNGSPVDWFVIYKLPIISESENPVIKNGTAFYYMDVNSTGWVLSDKGLLEQNQAVYHTLKQVYTSPNGSIAYMMYNDEPPNKRGYLSHGHTKGTIAFNNTEGFWLITSLPKFPSPKSDGYKYPDSGHTYGQTFLCITMNYDMLDVLGSIFLYTYPTIYDHQLSQSYYHDNPNLVEVMGGRQGHTKDAPWYDETLLVSKGHHYFRSFEKSTYFGRDLYDGWLSTRLKYELLVETWQNGKGNTGSNCSIPYKVFNIQELTFPGDDNVMFSTHKDHSKWAVSRPSGNWVCIGDINRQITQFKRGGGQVCFQNNAVWKAFVNLVTDYDTCSPFEG